MDNVRRSAPASFLILGVIFLTIGFVQQKFTLSFTSGLFNLGLIFVLSGSAAYFLRIRT